MMNNIRTIPRSGILKLSIRFPFLIILTFTYILSQDYLLTFSALKLSKEHFKNLRSLNACHFTKRKIGIYLQYNPSVIHVFMSLITSAGFVCSIISLLLLLAGDVHPNPGPETSFSDNSTYSDLSSVSDTLMFLNTSPSYTTMSKVSYRK